METIRNGKIYTEPLIHSAVSVVKEALCEYRILHKKAGRDFQYRSVDEATELLLDSTYQLIIEDEYLLCYTIEDNLWFSTDKILSEVLLKRLSKGTTTLSYVVQCMEFLAKHHGCTKIELSTMAQKGEALPRLYQRYGFSEVSRSLTKKV